MKRKASHQPPLPACRLALGTLARALVRARLLNEGEADAIALAAQQRGVPFVSALADSGKIDGPTLAAFICRTFGFPLIAPESLDQSALPLGAVSHALLQSGVVLPLAKHGQRLTVVVADPTDTTLLDQLRASASGGLGLVVADVDCLRKCVAQAMQASDWTHQV